MCISAQLGVGLPLASVYGSTAIGIGMSATFLYGLGDNFTMTAMLGYDAYGAASDIPFVIGVRYALAPYREYLPYVGGGLRMRLGSASGTSLSLSASGIGVLAGATRTLNAKCDLDVNAQLHVARNNGGAVLGIKGGVIFRLNL
jgi:hypothetical protein